MCSMNEHPVKEDVLKILRLLSSEDNFSQRDLSGHLGISLGKTNYLLKSIARKGLIKIIDFTVREQKLKRVKYMLTKKGIERKVFLTHSYLKIKEREYLDLKKELEKVT